MQHRNTHPNGPIPTYLAREADDTPEAQVSGPKPDGTTRKYYRRLMRYISGHCSHCGKRFGDGSKCQVCGSHQTRIT